MAPPRPMVQAMLGRYVLLYFALLSSLSYMFLAFHTPRCFGLPISRSFSVYVFVRLFTYLTNYLSSCIYPSIYLSVVFFYCSIDMYLCTCIGVHMRKCASVCVCL